MNGNYGINDLSCQKKGMALHTKKLSALLNSTILIQRNKNKRKKEIITGHISFMFKNNNTGKKDTYVFKTQNHNFSI